MKRICLLALLMVTMSFSGVFATQVVNSEMTTNRNLVNLIIDELVLDNLENTDSFSDIERFKSQTHMLKKWGITRFVGSDPDDIVTRGIAANSLYFIITGSRDATIAEKIDYLAAEGYIFAGAENDPMPLAELNFHTAGLSKKTPENRSTSDRKDLLTDVNTLGFEFKGILVKQIDSIPQ